SNFHRCFLSVPPQEDRTTIRGRRLIWWIGVGWLARSRRIRISAARRPSSYFGGETAVSGISATSALSSSRSEERRVGQERRGQRSATHLAAGSVGTLRAAA